MATLGLFLTAVLAVPTATQAQVVRGIVVDSLTGGPIGAGFVVLLDASDNEVARTLTDRQGRFSLRAPFPGRFRLRSIRIGYRSFTSAPIDLAAQSEIDGFRLAIPVASIRLDDITIEAEQTCRLRRDVGRETAALWAEAEKALTAVAWTAASAGYTYEATAYERELDLELRIVQEDRTPRVFDASRPYGAVPVESLMVRGFAVESVDESVFSAPDAEVLFSDPFLETHCFELVPPALARPGLVGLSFEPTPDRRLPEIEGTLWLHSATAELSHIEYRYVNLEMRIPNNDLGGEIGFFKLPTGGWIVGRWSIRMPIVHERTNTGLVRGRLQLVGFQETGADVTVIRDGNGARVFDLEGATLTGAVFDSTQSRPLAGADVTLVGTGFATRTDRDGQYQLDGLPPGRYTVRFAHPRVDMFGLPTSGDVTLARGRAATASLHVPSIETLRAVHCPGGDPEAGVLAGRALEANSRTPLADVEVTIRWGDVTDAGPGSRRRREWVTTTTNTAGGYFACGLPDGRRLLVEGRLPDDTVQQVYTRLDPGEFRQVDLRFRRRP